MEKAVKILKKKKNLDNVKTGVWSLVKSSSRDGKITILHSWRTVLPALLLVALDFIYTEKWGIKPVCSRADFWATKW